MFIMVKKMDGIFFDLDGTLWNAIPQMVEAYNEAMIENNYKYRFDYNMVKSYMGLTPEETAVIAFNDVDLEKGMALFKIMYDKELLYLRETPGKLYDNVEGVLNLLSKKYPLYIVSNADKGYIEAFLEGTKLSKFFKGHLAAGDTGLAKWQNILLLKQKEEIDRVIYIGDTNKDMVESNKAGVLFVHAAYGFGVIEDKCNKIDSISELPEIIERLFK